MKQNSSGKIRLDQHFMVDKSAILKIVRSAQISKDDIVLEIGGGTGNLTEALCSAARRVYVIEADSKLASLLKEKFGHRVEVLKGSAARIKWPNFDKLVANIPYSICEPLIWRLVRCNFDCAVLTVPKRFALSLKENGGNDKNKEGNKYSDNYSNKNVTKISFVFNLFFKVKILFDVPPSAFKPSPKVESSAIKIKRKKRAEKDSKMRLLGAIISQYDKKFKKAFIEYASSQGITKNQARDILFSLDLRQRILEKKVRALSLRDLLQIENVLKPFDL